MKKILEFKTDNESIYVSYDSVDTSVLTVIHDFSGLYEAGTVVKFDDLADVYVIVRTYISDKE